MIVIIIEFKNGYRVSSSTYINRSDRLQCFYVGGSAGSTVAGQTGVPGGWSYQFSSPTSITFDQYGNMYVMDSGNNRIQRWWSGSTYGVTVVAAGFSNPRGIAFDSSGNLAIADYSYARVVLAAIVCRK